MLKRPDPSEYEAYYQTYTSKIPDGHILDILDRELENTLEVLACVGPDRESFRYEPDKWSVREVVGHMIDTERVFAFRALCFARAAGDPLPSMEQDEWAAISVAGDRSLGNLAAEFEHVRRANVLMFRGFDDEAWVRRGVASGFDFTVRSLPWILAGHEIHHRRVLEERYLG